MVLKSSSNNATTRSAPNGRGGAGACLVRRVRTINAFFSSMVWKRPCPNLDVVSMNLRSIFSEARRLVWTSRD